MLRWADEGSGVSYYALSYFLRRGSARVLERLATQILYFGLLKLRDHLEYLRATNPRHWRFFCDMMIERLNYLTGATDLRDVLRYGNLALDQARHFPGADNVLQVVVRLEEQLASRRLEEQLVRPVVVREGGPPERAMEEVPPSHIYEPVRDVRQLSASLLNVLTAQRAASISLYPETATDNEPKRYTDLTLYEGHLFSGNDLAGSRRLPDDVALSPGAPYTLEVAIRLKRTGIDADRESLRPVLNPRRDKEDLTVYVLATPLFPDSETPCVEIPDSFLKITWPYNADSDSAFFRLEVNWVPRGKTLEGMIEVRLYDRSLDLLDIVQVSIAVAHNAPSELIPELAPRHLIWPSEKPGVLQIDPDAPPRRLSINVSPGNNGFLFEFVFRDNRNVIKIPATSKIKTGDIQDLLERLRDLWTEMVVTNYATKITVTQTTFEGCLGQLAKIGGDAWDLLFGTRYGSQRGATETIGDLLASSEPPEGARIQITYSSSIGDFVFPWSILYPPAPGSASVDPLRFWGARYQIEQVRRGPELDSLDEEPINVVFALDPSFGHAGLQTALLRNYETAAGKEKLFVTKPISDKKTLVETLVRQPSAHLCYFYCHGYAPAGPSILRRDGVQLLKQAIESIPKRSHTRKLFETLLTLIPKMGNVPWIYIGGAEIREDQIRREKFFNRRRPIVFLNMCHSAALVPTMSSGFVRLFLDHDASAIIGTECVMTSVFAHAFAEVLLNALFYGDDVGCALLKARRYFLSDDLRNPLGLAYTLYGRGTTRLGTGPIIASSPAQTWSRSEQRCAFEEENHA